MTFSLKKLGYLFLTALGGVSAGSLAWAESAPAPEKKAPVMRRISAEQYANIIADVFGPQIRFNGRFEPDIREGGLQAIGSSQVSVTGTGLEQYGKIAQAISKDVLGDDHRRLFLNCTPTNESSSDDACARGFLSGVGRQLFRRPLTKEELDLAVRVASDGATTLKSFYAGLELALSDLLVSPQFLFRMETVESDKTGKQQVDGYSKASRLSFLLWNSGPDIELLAAAERGDLRTAKGLGRQVDRMIASPRLQAGVRAFFSDMFAFDQFATLAKDTAIYPKFDINVAKDAQEQTLRTLVDLLVVKDGDYRDIFTTRRTFMTPVLASVYKVPIARINEANGEPDRWQSYEFPANDPRAGILMQIGFVALHAHEGRSSPTIRGRALREIMLCQKVPDPPGNVEFKIVQDTSNPEYKTARQRLAAHAINPVCAGCHKLIDPMGLALENFDGGGNFQTSENGAQIDTSGQLDGVKFSDGVGLGQAVHDNPATTKCAVNRAASYALGRRLIADEEAWRTTLEQSFAKDGYRFTALLKRIATSAEFYSVSQ